MKKIFTSIFAVYMISCALTILGAGGVFAQTALVNSDDAMIINPDASDDPTPEAPEQFTATTRKAPYLIYPGNNTEMQILWQLTSTDTCTIEWGSDTLYTLGNAPTYEYGSDHQHTCTLMDLIPGSKYYYRVTVNDVAHTGSFHAAPDQGATAVKFMAYGDTRTYPANHSQVAAAMIAAYTEDQDLQSLVVVVGDLVGAGNNESDWTNQFFTPSYPNIQELLATMPYQSCMGNHEQSGVLFKKYFPYPFVSGRYWSFDYGPAHFVVVDQYVSYTPGSAQLAWIENDLANSQKPWKFIYLHAPGWSAGSHDNSANVQNYIQPLCERYGVPIVFGGHNHYYARAVVNDVHHVTTGGGGAPLYAPVPTSQYVVSAVKAHHFCTVEIDGDVLDFKAINTAGTVIDSFTIAPEVAVESDEAEALIPEFILHPAYPNPFNPVTTISFSMPAASSVTLNVYNVLGQRVQTLVDEELEAGLYHFSWDGKNDLGQDVSSGVYICKLQAGGRVQGSKILLLR